jgi:hypothetical protein
VGGQRARVVPAAGLLCPHLSLIEGVWRRLEGFLMPRRFYDSVAELKAAVLHASHLPEAVEVQCSLGGT